MFDVEKISNEADVILDGFATKKENQNFRVFNLNDSIGVSVFSENLDLIESNMNDIEIELATQKLKSSLKYLSMGEN